MKTNTFCTLCTAGLAFFAATSTQAQHKPINEGTWRGVFTLNERQVPFNFELRTGGGNKSLDNASFALVNGSRRDYFVVKQIAPDSIFIKMNTYMRRWWLKLRITDD